MNHDEYRRRQEALASEMAAAGLDLLVAAGRGLLTQYGYVYYLAGYCPVIRPAAVIMPAGEAPILAVSTGSDIPLAAPVSPIADVRIAAPGNDGSGMSALAALIRDVAVAHGSSASRIGVVGLEEIISADEFARWQRALPKAAFVPASGLLLGLKAIKSEVELAEMRKAAAVADEGLQALLAALRRGATLRAATGACEACLRTGGAQEILVYCSPGPHFLHRPFAEMPRDGDLLSVFVELSNEAGYWVELARLIAVGRLDDARRRVAESCAGAMAVAENAIVPGTTAGAAYAAIAREIGRQGLTSGLLYGHGVGVDHDLPLIGQDEATEIRAGMTIALHPHIIDAAGDAGGSLCDTFIVGDAGARPLSRWARETIQL